MPNDEARQLTIDEAMNSEIVWFDKFMDANKYDGWHLVKGVTMIRGRIDCIILIGIEGEYQWSANDIDIDFHLWSAKPDAKALQESWGHGI